MAGKKFESLVQKMLMAVDRDDCFDESGVYPFFSYKTEHDLLLSPVSDHKHKKAILKRPDAIFSIKPPFTFGEFKSKVDAIQKGWKGKKGTHEFKDSDSGSDPFYWLCDFTGSAYIDKMDGDSWIHKRIVVFAITTDSKYVGHINFDLSICLDETDKRAFFQSDVHIVWVAPEFRGVGYGADLGNIAGEVLGGIYAAVAELLPKNWVLDSILCADYDTAGGEAVVGKVYDELVATFEQIEDSGCKCRVSEPMLDSGF